ncbi:MAG: ftsH [Chthoniobacteraceae bacterium]|nr:ftsH [Chthoniobacteraceae bacterium]MDB6171827.1 ftsH [Chthoniobacteraceae bacterium]
MAQPENRNSKGNRPPPVQDPNFNWRGLVLFALAIALIGGAWFLRGGGVGSVRDVPWPELEKKLAADLVVKEKGLELISEPGTQLDYLKGTMRETAEATVTVPFRTQVNLQFMPDLQKTLKDANIAVTPKSDTNLFASALISFLPIILCLLVLYFFFRQQIRMAGKGALNFGKSKARMLARDKNKITFKDVAGVEEAKEEVEEIVDFLKDPKKFQKLGGRIPKGVLMIGPPGTGKTLLARAIAGEADVPFFSISGSDFVEMFVGVGASRVRDMFEQGKKSAPCIIFIDEIDAVGRHRGHGMGGGHDEREQTLNALLVEMDGFDTQEGVIIIAATNRPDVLDPALLRPGRFDRQITVNLPDVKGREEILKVHSKRVKILEGTDLAVIARGTPGYSGAELANVINEAALLAARRGLKAIGISELEEARDKVRWGRERRSLAISEKEKENTAYHEAGHALLLEMLEHTEPLHKVTIIPRGPSLGSTMWLPQEDKYNMRKLELIDSLCVTMGGRVAEEIVFGDVTSGARGDIKQATGMARKMVCEWGMSEKLGMVEYGEHDDYVFLGRELSKARDYSEATAQEIDKEVRKLCDDAYARATELLTTHRSQLVAIAKALLEYETLDGSQIRDILEFGKMKNPPSAPTRPHSEPPPLKQPEQGTTLAPDYPTGLTESPA